MKETIKRGFTMVELLVVIAIMTVLMTIILTGVNKQRVLTRDKIRVAGIDQIRLGLENYKLVCREYPAILRPNTNNGCRYGESLKDFIPNIPRVPVYAGNSGLFGQLGETDYLYTGMSSIANGKCYEYHIGVQLEYDYADPANSEYLKNDHDVNVTPSIPYPSLCRNSDPHIKNIFDDPNEDNSHKIYDFRSQTY